MSQEPNPNCRARNKKSHHTYKVSLKCEPCGHSGEDIITRRCMCPQPRMRRVSCKGCERGLMMVFKCMYGSFDDDYEYFQEGDLLSRVENIDDA